MDQIGPEKRHYRRLGNGTPVDEKTTYQDLAVYRLYSSPKCHRVYNLRTLQTKVIFRHKVKTSRRFVFENIMDLDHVCTLHKRWFRNLRIVVQRPEYVEYRLTSLFYGLKQETTARGGPIDENRYWYEFITPLAKARVDGLMEGKDGVPYVR